jgi:hypothetical protein
VEALVGHVEEFLAFLAELFCFLFEGLAVGGTAEFVEHQSDAWESREEHFALIYGAFEQFVLDVRIDGQVGGFSEGASGAVGVDQARKKNEIAWAFVFRALLGLDVEVNAVEWIFRVVLVELDYVADVTQELFTVLAGLIGVGAVEESFNMNVIAMEKFNEVCERGFG